METRIKDPDAILDYGFDWSDWLRSATIASSTWSATGLTIEASSKTDTETVAIISGGSAGQTYTATNHIVTDTGLADGRSLTLSVVNR